MFLISCGMPYGEAHNPSLPRDQNALDKVFLAASLAFLLVDGERRRGKGAVGTESAGSVAALQNLVALLPCTIAVLGKVQVLAHGPVEEQDLVGLWINQRDPV